MGLFSDFISTIFGSDANVSTDPKATSVNNNGESISVRNTSVIIDHDAGTHDTVFSKSSVDLKTGQSKYEEGSHGPHFKK